MKLRQAIIRILEQQIACAGTATVWPPCRAPTRLLPPPSAVGRVGLYQALPAARRRLPRGAVLAERRHAFTPQALAETWAAIFPFTR
ncbi:MAG: hypothetical protein R2911_05210 [Caldilineaceae bacterium]